MSEPGRAGVQFPHRVRKEMISELVRAEDVTEND